MPAVPDDVPAILAELRRRVARLGRAEPGPARQGPALKNGAPKNGAPKNGAPKNGAPKNGAAVLGFGVPPIDARLPGGGLAMGALHEVSGGGPDIEHGAAAALLIAGLLARARGQVLWAIERRDLFAPALQGVGLPADRVVFVEAGRPAAVLLVMEEGLRQRGLAGVVGEVSGRLTLTASRRLQLAAETSGVTAFALRRGRRPQGADQAGPRLAEPTAAVTRWLVSALPSDPPLPHAPRVNGLGRARWRLDLLRCRGGEAFSWIVEACDAQGHLAMAADLVDRPAAAGRDIAG